MKNETGIGRMRLMAGLRYLVFLAVSTSLILIALELGLRLFFGLPQGLFNIRPLSRDGIYLPNERIHFVWAPIPYTVVSNSLGFRGPEISKKKPEGTYRIIALGDSITDGFYVENENTYPYLLEERLRERDPAVEVINAAQGWSSIDTEFEILQKFCMPLDPDLVLLTFVSNDIEEIRGKTREQLLDSRSFDARTVEVGEWLMFGRTALGELVLDATMRRNVDKYRKNRTILLGHEQDARYRIPGGENFEENAHHYLKSLSEAYDSIAFYEAFTLKQIRVVEDYCWMLGQVQAYCQARQLPLCLIYYPDYAEIYLPDRCFPMSEYLAKACEELGIPFLNLTPAFRAAKGKVLHLAPLDFHPNPDGNKVIADTIADFLQAQGYAKRKGKAIIQ